MSLDFEHEDDEAWHVKAFGRECRHIAMVPRPVGMPCASCDKPIGPDDDGFFVVHYESSVSSRPWHRDCWEKSLGIRREQWHESQ